MRRLNNINTGGQGGLKVLVLGLMALGLCTQTSNAVMLKGSGDPTANTTAPTGALADSGWQYQGQWGGVLGTPIASQYFIAARHVGGAVGGTFVFQGMNYTTTAYWDDPENSDLRIWKVDGVFPIYAPLYFNNDELGKGLVVIGRGTQRGAAVYMDLVSTNCTTNTVTLKSLGISRKEAQKLYPTANFSGSYMTVISCQVVTNNVLKGWKSGASDNVMRWGENQVIGAGSYIVATFDNNGGDNEAYLSAGDSSGAVFIQDGGVWKLAGINYGIDGPFSTNSTEPSFYGAITDLSGMYVAGSYYPNNGQARPACFYATRISARFSWILSIITQ